MMIRYCAHPTGCTVTAASPFKVAFRKGLAAIRTGHIFSVTRQRSAWCGVNSNDDPTFGHSYPTNASVRLCRSQVQSAHKGKGGSL